MNIESIPGIVYILTNPAMPGLVKIGKTARESVEPRLSELYSTGVPVPFECAYAARVEDEAATEQAFHRAFRPYQINPNREFFSIEPEQAIALLKLVSIEDVTPEIQDKADNIDPDSQAGVKKLKSRRPPLNFSEMEIPIDSVLKFTRADETVIVKNEKRVIYECIDYSLTAITQKLLNNSYAVAPAPYWTYEGKGLQKIYDETYPYDDA